jgi:hypothetical protein
MPVIIHCPFCKSDLVAPFSASVDDSEDIAASLMIFGIAAPLGVVPEKRVPAKSNYLRCLECKRSFSKPHSNP